MKQKEAELLIIQSKLQVAHERIETLESEERMLLLALGRDPDNPQSGLTIKIKNKKQRDALLAFFQSPEFGKRLASACGVMSRAMLAIEKRQFKKSNSKWKPLSGDYAAALFGTRPSRTAIRARVKAGNAFKAKE